MIIIIVIVIRIRTSTSTSTSNSSSTCNIIRNIIIISLMVIICNHIVFVIICNIYAVI